MADSLIDHSQPTPSDSVASDSSHHTFGFDLEAVTAPYRNQSVLLTSAVLIGLNRENNEDGAVVLCRLNGGADGRPDGEQLIVVSDDALDIRMDQLFATVPCRAITVLTSRPGNAAAARRTWERQRALFDRGLVAIASVAIARGEAHCFLVSDLVQSHHNLGAGTRGYVTMTSLGRNGYFGNQLFQYAAVRLFALRHRLTAAFPSWDGQQLFGLDDPSCAGLGLPELAFKAFSDDERRLWEFDDPPINVDLWGYFQEIPGAWRRHRALLRRIFSLPMAHQRALDDWRQDVTRGGRRTLVAIHLRRKDYRRLQQDFPWFRVVPEAWYLTVLRAIWPTLRDPVLYVASDEPDIVRPCFAEFENVSPVFGEPADSLPEHVRDFEILRRADHVAICNSSFSRMAAILAQDSQRCFLPSFDAEAFEPYDPWRDAAFWARFERTAPTTTVTARSEPRLPESPAQAAIYFDVSDLLLYVRDHRAVSGIQRS